jgi:NTP pyrophosphatase (non-canonical NTP hydrolase)
MPLFPEEAKLIEDLNDEWYDDIKAVTEIADSIFSSKGEAYDREKPFWTRAEWPWGDVHEISKKANRVEQLTSSFDPNNPMSSVDWEDVEEELVDILNYCRMFAAITRMLKRREENG